MKIIDNLILSIQQHEHEGFLLILIALLGITMCYSFNVVSGILESSALLVLMAVYILICLTLLYRYIQPRKQK